MVRETVLAGISIFLTIAIGWLVDHPHKILGTILALVAFVIIVLVSYFRQRDEARRLTPRRIIRRKQD